MIRLLSQDYQQTIIDAARAIQAGGLVAFPTETVYGLGASALDANAVAGIFALKGRPTDNPLIVHVDGMSMARSLVEFTEAAEALAASFWPGPLTLVLRSRGIVPEAVTAGLDTVGVRMPDNDAALSLISASGVPIAAPSANKSGSPSPTAALHVQSDFGQELLILDDGECRVGLESTVIDMTKEVPTILRPGAVTVEMVRDVMGQCECAPSFVPDGEEKPASPGMKYRHYSPQALLTVVEGNNISVAEAIKYLYDKDIKKGESPLILATRENRRYYGKRDIAVMGSLSDSGEIARSLYALLRGADEDGYSRIYFEAIPKAGLGFAVMNRVYKAAAYNIVKV